MSELAKGCHRSHPHEGMDSECGRLTKIAKRDSSKARANAKRQIHGKHCGCLNCDPEQVQ